MSNKFLTQFQKEPDSAFNHKLWRQLLQVVPVTAVPPQPSPNRRPFRLAAALVVLICLFVAGFSPAVRAQIETIIRQIGGVNFKETAVYPGIPEEEIIIIENETLTGTEAQLLEDARQRLGLQFNLPTSLPGRFTLFDDVVYGSVAGPSAMFRWNDSQSYYVLVLDVQHYNPEVNWVVGENSTQEVQINGQSAALITGGWNADTQAWDEAEGAQVLRWHKNGIEYSLTMFGNILTQEEFIAIAESIE